MVPIFEQGDGKGIGHDVATFLNRFEEICDLSIRQGRARAFAFVIYDFEDVDFKKMLTDRAVFANLDRLIRNSLSLFYLHSGRSETIRKFNSGAFKLLGLDPTPNLPCVLFFRVNEGRVVDIECLTLDTSNEHTRFHDLYETLEYYLSEQPAVDTRKHVANKVSSLVSLAIEEFVKQFVKVWVSGS